MKSKYQIQLEKVYSQIHEAGEYPISGDRGQFAFHAARRAAEGDKLDKTDNMCVCPICGSLQKTETSCSRDGFPLSFVKNPKSNANASDLRNWIANNASDPKIKKMMDNARYVK